MTAWSSLGSKQKLTGVLGENAGGRPLAFERAARIRTRFAPAHIATGKCLRQRRKTFFDVWVSSYSYPLQALKCRTKDTRSRRTASTRKIPLLAEEGLCT